MISATETIKGKLIDDSDVDIVFKKYITMPQKQALLKEYSQNIKVRNGVPEWEVNLSGFYGGLLKVIFVKESNNFGVDDIVPESVEGYLGEKINNFLIMGMGSKKSTD